MGYGVKSFGEMLGCWNAGMLERSGDLSELREQGLLFFCLKLHPFNALHLSSVIDEVSA